MKYYSHEYKQLDIGLFRSSLSELDKSNRWVVLGDTLPWPELEKEYNSRLQNDKKGAGNKPARMIIGAMMIKHRLNLSDVETIEMIRKLLTCSICAASQSSQTSRYSTRACSSPSANASQRRTSTR